MITTTTTVNENNFSLVCYYNLWRSTILKIEIIFKSIESNQKETRQD